MSEQTNPTTPGSTNLNGAPLPLPPGNPTPTYPELVQECQKLRAELNQVKEERDGYFKALVATLPPEEFNFTKEEVFSHIGPESSFGELIQELKKDPAYDKQP